MDDGVALNPFSTGTDDEREAVKVAKKRMLYAEVDRERGIEPGGKTFTFTDGRRFRILTVVDDFSRECLALVADTSLSGTPVARQLDGLLARRGNQYGLHARALPQG